MKCDKAYRISYTEKAKKLLADLNLEEKVNLMSGIGYYFGNAELYQNETNKHYNYIPFYCGRMVHKGIPRMIFTDGTRGVVIGTGKNTCFPVTMLRGASFDTKLEEKIGRAIAKEARACSCNLFAGICINLPYHPGWGRSQETYGEDSYHIGQMGSALVRGVQGENVMACVKHYAFNSMEISRYKVNIECDKRTEREVYLSHFKDCIDAGAAVVMSSYNLYQGAYCGQSEYLLNQVLKKEWDFDGFVMSDFNLGIRDTIEAANNGQDMEMCNTNYYGDKLVQAVRDGFVPMEKIDEACLRIVRTIIAFHEADDKEYDKTIRGCKQHIRLALTSARKGITLIKNDKNVLPFKKEKRARIAVFGKLANQDNVGDHGSSFVYPPYVVTPLQGIARVCKDAEVIYYPGTDFGHARNLAKNADYTLFFVGYDYDDEGEHVEGEEFSEFATTKGGDRINLMGLYPEDVNLIREVAPVNKNSCVVLIGGNMILIDEWKDYVNSILMAYYPGMEGGTAIAEILFGDVNPSGKLPFVITKSEEDLPEINWQTTYQYYEYYHGYTKLEKEEKKPSVPFGYGLSYTTFTVTEPKFTIKKKYLISSCLIENTGRRYGEEVIQVYVGYKNSSIDRPRKELKGFQKVGLKPGEKKRIEIKTPIDKLRWYNEMNGQWELEHMEYEVYIGTSSANEDLWEDKIVL
ncbi:glycoside hydrolase family 3 C-terminal domain-containing protein [Mobilitalea sibirica]|uniref:Glycoside hydrolase family 3 C-terminal domain-containing protein n=1 Tax=Mobilitalea sibirica TaxID=1462919 RepID=A0A8J7HA79_9FIRM|nr:glycoside hydrolase family 3 C-terminal domain-containing protein [Mobilitalea sibirica]MBH1941971.1 glycoside hydrolase family 3 C-terminal domain-containing protein [Mobilitalea sibirica]